MWCYWLHLGYPGQSPILVIGLLYHECCTPADWYRKYISHCLTSCGSTRSSWQIWCWVRELFWLAGYMLLKGDERERGTEASPKSTAPIHEGFTTWHNCLWRPHSKMIPFRVRISAFEFWWDTIVEAWISPYCIVWRWEMVVISCKVRFAM